MVPQTPCLDAIQSLPGVTLSEKFKWIAGFIKERISECNNLEDVMESEKIPRLLVPLVQVQAAVMMNKKNRADQSTYGAIAEALKSQDEIVIANALQARSFFDGSNETITNVQYFFENLFPNVSLYTRKRIIKNLSTHLTKKNAPLAEQFFLAIASYYGIEQALPLLIACDESFAYDTIVKRRIVLSRKMVKQMFYKNPDFVVRYLRLSKPNTDPTARNLHRVNIEDYKDFLTALIKKRIDSFVELYEMHEKKPPFITLSSKCAEAFLKNGREHLQRNPTLYINMLPLKLISNSRMESIFVKLFPANIKKFNTNQMLAYLEYYPQDKKLDLFLKSYQEAYGKSILDDKTKVTANLMRLLPTDERVRQARIKLEDNPEMVKSVNYSVCWHCYLPIEESMPLFHEEMTKPTETECRAIIVCNMIYTCKINNDNQALLDLLGYIKRRHKNERCWFLIKVFETLSELYDLPQLSDDYWTILIDMIVHAHVKQELGCGDSRTRIIEAAIHHKLLQNQPIDQMIDILVDLNSKTVAYKWNILVEYPKYERLCLEACINAVSKQYKSEKSPWKEEGVEILYNICNSIYYFNDAHVSKTNRVERMSFKNYPWLMQAVEEIMTSTKPNDVFHVIADFQRLFKLHETDFYERFFSEKEKIADVQTGAALKLLRNNPEDILTHWKEYLKACQNYWYKRHTKRFVTATRWYKDIPMRFIEQCLEDLSEKKEVNSLVILSMLLHGETIAKLIEPLIPTDKTINIHEKEAKLNYTQIRHIIYCMKIANPPVPLTLIGKLCEGDYFPVAAAALMSISMRTNVMDVVGFAKMLAKQRVSVRKRGIRLMYMVAARDDLYSFLDYQWKTVRIQGLRDIIFDLVTRLFMNDTVPATWSLLTQVISTMTKKDEVSFTRVTSLVDVVPNEYIVKFEMLVLEMIDKLEAEGVVPWRIVIHIRSLLSTIDAAIYSLLPEDFIKELMKRYLFHQELTVSSSACKFMVTGLLLLDKDKFDERMRLFSDVFTEAIKNGWNKPHPTKSYFYPVNNAVHRFHDRIVQAILFSEADVEIKLRLIDGILSTILSLLSPQMDAMSYLLLVYTKEVMCSKTPMEFGMRIRRKLPELVEIFSSLFIFYMTDVINYILDLKVFHDYSMNDKLLGIIEGLMEVESIEATLMGVKLMKLVMPNDNMDRYEVLMTKFTKHDHPVIKSIVCDIINKMQFS